MEMRDKRRRGEGVTARKKEGRKDKKAMNKSQYPVRLVA